MRFVWLTVLGGLAVVMVVFTPYMLRTVSTWEAISWLAMLVAAFAGVVVVVRTELLLRRMKRAEDRDVSGT
ncbi:hypothetical protein [Streptomyces albidoflavus]|uniref:hypothetical protein n=1 Tax=Streptomyces albidoflavus TaxID=1886 RepID=UPI0033D6910F